MFASAAPVASMLNDISCPHVVLCFPACALVVISCRSRNPRSAPPQASLPTAGDKQQPPVEGTRVMPGMVLTCYATSGAAGEDAAGNGQQAEQADLVVAGPGTRAVRQRSANVVLISATRVGLVHWEANEVSVLVPRKPSEALLSTERVLGAAVAGKKKTASHENDGDDDNGDAPPPVSESAGAGPAPVAPTLRSVVHVRITRVTRNAAFGDIIAVDGTWCGAPAALIGASRVSMQTGVTPALFRASVRTDDVFSATGKKAAELLATPMANFVRPNDVVLGVVVALADARQYQVSLAAPHCGVVKAKSRASNFSSPLERVPENREMMRCPATGTLEPRWAPLKNWHRPM
jgi:exosome complex RNA-binding protein Csl4